MNRRVMAARAAANRTIVSRNPGPVSTDVAARVLTPSTGSIRPVRNRKSPRMTAAQRDSQGRISAWTRSPYAPKGGWR